jgi:quinoprotein glucose dehydrogenase
MRTSLLCFVAVSIVCTVPGAFAQEGGPAPGPGGARRVMPASDEGEAAMKAFRLAPGFKAELFAAEPHVANISGFDIAPDGKVYVVEVFRRRGGGVLDMRTLPAWLDDDLASRTVADRIALVRRRLAPQDVRAMEVESDRVRLVEDRDGDGRADHAAVFADGFRKLEDGTAAGVLALGGDVFFANIPNLWLLRDEDNDGKADTRKALHTGFGVHFNISGHDLHGLRLGPDGRVYFSVGDRGFSVTTPDGRVISNPDSGAVLRCEPDGSGLELFHTGLRNPQDLAFDEHGNLFTADNNSDGGDASRWVHVVEGGDSGWRTGYQWHDFPSARGPWNNERLWDVKSDVPAAYVLPPLANPDIAGPSGMTYTPGTGMPPDWENRFLVVDFRGGATQSGIWGLKNKPRGASFELVESKKLIWGVLPTDVEFGYDGGVYFSDWVDGWVPMGKGRLYRIAHEKARNDPAVAEARGLMRVRFGSTAVGDLARLLGHADVRVRVAAQLELARRRAFAALAEVATGDERRLARLHAIWGLRRMEAPPADAVAFYRPLLKDPDPEVRAQVAAALGNHGPAASTELLSLFHDPEDRVKFVAATAMSRIGIECTAEAVALLRQNDNRDPYLRHAAVLALAGRDDVHKMLKASEDPSPAVRLGIALALRRLKRPEVARFLDDPDPAIALEAARAINDTPIDEATGDLAAVAARASGPGAGKVRELILMRALNANFRVGTATSAAVLARFASRADVPDFLRVEALKMLGDWGKPATRDRVTGIYHPVPARDPQVAFDAVRPVLSDLLRNAPDPVRVAAAGLVAGAGLSDTTVLGEIVRNPKFSGAVRAAALEALVRQNSPDLVAAVEAAMADKDAVLRRAAILASAGLPEGVARLRKLVAGGPPRDQQAAFAALATMGEGPAVEALLLEALDRLLANQVAPEARLDLVAAAESRQASSAVAAKLKQYRDSFPQDDPLAAYRDTLVGGDREWGRRIFQERTDVQCLRCHSIKGEGGTAGPDLAGIGKKQSREYLLESILFPAQRIAPGFETVVVRVNNGDTFAGVLKSEDAKELVLIDPEKGELRIPTGTITGRRGGQSAMPSDIAAPLSKHDLRDLVEFLASLK